MTDARLDASYVVAVTTMLPPERRLDASYLVVPVTVTHKPENALSAAIRADNPSAYWRPNRPLQYEFVDTSAFSTVETASNTFQGGTWYTGSGTTGWIRAKYLTSTVVNQYSFICRSDATTRCPTSWTFEGSSNGTSWTTLDTRTSVTWAAGEEKFFTFSNSTAYLYYRLNVTATGGQPVSTQALRFGNQDFYAWYDEIAFRKMGLISQSSNNQVQSAAPLVGTGGYSYQGGTKTNGYIPTGTWVNSTTLTIEAVIQMGASGGNPFDRDNETSRVWQVQIGAGGAMTILWWTASGLDSMTAPAGTLSTSVPKHLMIRFDGTTAKINVNGTLVASKAMAGNLVSGTADVTIGSHTVGTLGYFTPIQVFDGKLDEIAFYTSALSDSRVTAHAAAFAGLVAPITYWGILF